MSRQCIRERKAQCLELVREGQDTIPALVDIMYAHQPASLPLTGLWMLIGYLDLLVEDGLVIEEEIDGVWHYRAT